MKVFLQVKHAREISFLLFFTVKFPKEIMAFYNGQPVQNETKDAAAAEPD